MDLNGPLAKTFHGAEELVRRLLPDEGFDLLVVRLDTLANRLFQLRNTDMGSPLESMLCEQTEESLYEVQPGGVRGREVEVESRVSRKPPFYCGGLVGR